MGKDKAFARQVFRGLNGRQDLDDKAMLPLDLLELKDDLPEKVEVINCKLDELDGNCQHITREIFRVHAIEPK